MQDVFHHAYRQNQWGDPESVSGPGSGLQRTAAFRDQIPPLLRSLGVQTLLDAACGDFNWMKEIELPKRYIGIDIVPELIAGNAKHQKEGRTFVHANFTRDPLPQVDLILCRDCLVHFSFEDIRAALRNFKSSGSRYLLTTTFVGPRENADVATGGWRPLNLERPPFDFPPPERAIDEQCLHTGGIYADKRLALWRLADLAV